MPFDLSSGGVDVIVERDDIIKRIDESVREAQSKPTSQQIVKPKTQQIETKHKAKKGRCSQLK